MSPDVSSMSPDVSSQTIEITAMSPQTAGKLVSGNLLGQSAVQPPANQPVLVQEFVPKRKSTVGGTRTIRPFTSDPRPNRHARTYSTCSGHLRLQMNRFPHPPNPTCARRGFPRLREPDFRGVFGTPARPGSRAGKGAAPSGAVGPPSLALASSGGRATPRGRHATGGGVAGPALGARGTPSLCRVLAAPEARPKRSEKFSRGRGIAGAKAKTAAP